MTAPANIHPAVPALQHKGVSPWQDDMSYRLLVLIAPVASAAEPGLSPNPVSPEAAQEEGILDTTRGQVRGFSLWLGESVNDWFGDRPFEDGGKVTKGRLGLRNLWR